MALRGILVLALAFAACVLLLRRCAATRRICACVPCTRASTVPGLPQST